MTLQWAILDTSGMCSESEISKDNKRKQANLTNDIIFQIGKQHVKMIRFSPWTFVPKSFPMVASLYFDSTKHDTEQTQIIFFCC